MIDYTDRKHLERCVQLAADALAAGNEPFGSILVSADGATLFEVKNEIGGGDATRHPEFAIARWAADHLVLEERAGGHRLHFRRTLPDVFCRQCLGQSRANRVRVVHGAALRLAD